MLSLHVVMIKRNRDKNKYSWKHNIKRTSSLSKKNKIKKIKKKYL